MHLTNSLRSFRLILLPALLIPVALQACAKPDGADEFRDGVPFHEDIVMTVPGGAAAQQSALTVAGVAKTQGALLGEKADLFKTTREITTMVNGATAAVLTMVKTITEFPASRVDTDVAVWGPYTGPLQANTWRLTVNRVGTGMFHYALEAKPRATDDTMYLTVLSGEHIVANPLSRRRTNLPAYGNGNFVLDWDNAQKLPDHDDNVGKAAFTYSRPSASTHVTIDATFTQVLDRDTGMLVDARYGYVQTPAQGGEFQFTLTKDAVVTTAALETMTVRSRWQESGAGRSDVKLAGGDLGGAEATASECWSSGDTGFTSVYLTNSYGDPAKLWGAPSACAFLTADYATF